MEINRENLFILVRISMCITFFIISGCSMPNNLNIQDQSFKYSNDISVVFGLLERLKNGQSASYSKE